MIIERETCRLCDLAELEFVYAFPLTTLADRYASEPNVTPKKFPQDIYICGNCGHVQIVNVLPQSELFDQSYTYKPSLNGQLSSHWREYADFIIRRLGRVPEKVLDIGSNDGSLLRAFKEHGSKLCVGVEPVNSLTEGYSDLGIHAIVDYWSKDVAAETLRQHGGFDLVCANNVFAHSDDLGGFTSAIRDVLADDGEFSTEFSYLENIITSSLVGVFFHEHLSHHHLLSLSSFLERRGLHVRDAKRVESQGGALVLVSSKNPSVRGNELSELLEQERKFLVTSNQIRKRLIEALLGFRRDFLSFFNGVDLQDRRIILVGASRSANHLIDFLGIRANVTLLLDSNPQKIGKFLFESSAPILDQDTHLPKRDDILIITAWAQTSSMLLKMREIYTGVPFTAISLWPRVTKYNF